MDEQHYHTLCNELFTQIEDWLDEIDADFENNGNVIEITTDNNDKIIINKQTPMREIWLASRQGGQHFTHQEGEWRDTRNGGLLFPQLKTIISD